MWCREWNPVCCVHDKHMATVLLFLPPVFIFDHSFLPVFLGCLMKIIDKIIYTRGTFVKSFVCLIIHTLVKSFRILQKSCTSVNFWYSHVITFSNFQYKMLFIFLIYFISIIFQSKLLLTFMTVFLKLVLHFNLSFMHKSVYLDIPKYNIHWFLSFLFW